MNNTTFSPYHIFWIEFKAVKGLVTKHDQKIFGHVFPGKVIAYRKNFASKERAIQYLDRDFSNLDKSYECRLSTDKQFSLAKSENNFSIPFTEKQNKEMIIINK